METLATGRYEIIQISSSGDNGTLCKWQMLEQQRERLLTVTAIGVVRRMEPFGKSDSKETDGL
jgi:hypothetical protein